MTAARCLGRAMRARALLLLTGLTLVTALVTSFVVTLGAAPADAGGTPVQTRRMQRIDKALTVARSLRGIPYHFGGTTRHGFDCSGYTRYVFAKIGEHLPRTSRQQYADTTRVSKRAVQRGDLVFFLENGRIYHVGIYAGDGRIWHSPHTGSSVRVERIWTSQWRAGRVLA